jgi:hypothetical protein
MPPPPLKPRDTSSSGRPRSTGLIGKISCTSVSTMCTDTSSFSLSSVSAPTTPSAATSIFVRPSGTPTPMEQLQSISTLMARAVRRCSSRISSDTGSSGSTGERR